MASTTPNPVPTVRKVAVLGGGLGGLTAALDQPEFATAIGLVKYGSLKKRQRVKRGAFMNTDAIKGMLSKILQRS